MFFKITEHCKQYCWKVEHVQHCPQYCQQFVSNIARCGCLYFPQFSNVSGNLLSVDTIASNIAANIAKCGCPFSDGD